MASQPLAIKLRCTSWGQVAAIHDRDLRRGKLFLKTQTPISLGREVRVDLVLPSGTIASFEGRVAHAVPPGERGPGVELVLTKVPPSTLYLIESALKSAAARPVDGEPAPVEDFSTAAAERDLESALEEELQGLRQMNPFQVLGLPVETTDDAVRQSFIELSKKYHPDLFARFESERGRQLASEIFVAIRDAYRKIGDATGRNAVRAHLAKGARRDLTPIFGVPITRGATPIMGVPVGGERPPSTPKNLAATTAREPFTGQPLPRREGTPVRGMPAQPTAQPPRSAPAPRRDASATPVRGTPLPRREGTLFQGVPTQRDPDAPEPIEIETSAPTMVMPPAGKAAPPAPPSFHTRVAPAVPPPPEYPLSEGAPPIVTFRGGSEAPAAPTGLNLDDLFRDIGDLPRSTHAMSPINLEEPTETRAASELVDVGRYEEALASYDEQLRRNPTDRSARAGKELAFGLKLAGAGDRQGAIQHLEAALEIEPWSERTARALNGIRRAQTDSRKGLLAKLLGRGS